MADYLDYWTAKRMGEPAERLTKEHFVREHLGSCKYCGEAVKMMRTSDTLQLIPDGCNCLLCGQHYFVEFEDLQDFLGFPPSYENIFDFPKVYERHKAKFRSIDDDWQPS